MRILGTGTAVPHNILTNDMLSTMVETSDEWIRSRTGIQARHIATNETTLSLALEASQAALDAACGPEGIRRDKIGIIICASVSNETRCPSLACQLQRDLGLRENVLAFDLNAACTGFVYALIVASRFVDDNSYALIVGVEVLSRLMDFTDRETCVLFGDGAGAVVVAPSAPVCATGTAGTIGTTGTTGTIGTTGTAGTTGTTFSPSAGAGPTTTAAAVTTTQPLFQWVAQAQGNSELLYIDNNIHMDGQGVFKFAVEVLVKSIRDVVAKSSLALEDIDLLICHQANERIINSAAKRLGLPFERFFMNLAHFGNTSAASIPLALDEAIKTGALRHGSTIVLAGFGGGLTAGAICLYWE